MARHPDRYELHELTGINITEASQCGGGAKMTTDVMLLDRDDCYHVVGYWPAAGARLEHRRREAQSQCDRLNEEHRRWIHAGRWS